MALSLVTSPSDSPLLPTLAGGRSHFSLLLGPSRTPECSSQNNISGGFLNCKRTHFLTSVGIYVNIVMLGSIFLAMSLDFATLTSVKKVRNLQHENLLIQDINFPTKNSKSPDLDSRMYHMYEDATSDNDNGFIPIKGPRRADISDMETRGILSQKQ